MSVNKVILVGRLGADLELKTSQKGTPYVNFTMATNESYKDKQTGQKVENSEWHRISFFGKQAETLAQYVGKGSQLYVEGKLQTTKYEKDGVDRYSTSIIGERFNFIGSKPGGSSDKQDGTPEPKANGGGADGSFSDMDDVPF